MFWNLSKSSVLDKLSCSQYECVLFVDSTDSNTVEAKNNVTLNERAVSFVIQVHVLYAGVFSIHGFGLKYRMSKMEEMLLGYGALFYYRTDLSTGMVPFLQRCPCIGL